MGNLIEINATNIEIILRLHAFFQDESKVVSWLKTKNPMFGNLAPALLMARGQKFARKVLQFIDDAQEGNLP